MFEIEIAVFFGIVLLIFKRERRIGKSLVFFTFILIYCLAFIFTPYWNFSFRYPLVNFIALFFLSVHGTLWAFFSSSDLKFPKISLDLRYFAVLAALVYLLNYIPISADIAVRGDEDFHINSVLDLRQYVNRERDLSIAEITRYPFFQKWLSLLFILPGNSYDIKIFRLVPLISTILLAWFLFYFFEKSFKNKFLALLYSFAIITVPLQFFYENILYLDMPLIVGMTVVVFFLETFLSSDPGSLKKSPIFYLLFFIGFLKETAIFFLFLLIVLRMFKKLKEKGLRLTTLFSEIFLYLLIISPILTYLTFRLIVSGFRPYGFDVSKILIFSNYLIIGRELILKQIGVLFLAGIFGFYYLLKTRKLKLAFKIAFLLLGILWLFLGDNLVYMDKILWNVGYQRNNLYLLPFLIYLTYIFVISIRRHYQIVFLVILLISNLLLVSFKKDGVRLPNWGSPQVDTAEYTYPYDKAISTLAKDKSIRSLFVVGNYSSYKGLRFYQEKYKFYPNIVEETFSERRFDTKIELDLLDSFFNNLAARTDLPDAVLYHSVNSITLDREAIFAKNYKVERVIENSLNRIYLFKRIN